MQNHITESLRQMTPEAFAMMGAPTIAYVRAVTTEEGPAYGLFAVNGQQIGTFAEREHAFIVARQNDLDPVSVH